MEGPGKKCFQPFSMVRNRGEQEGEESEERSGEMAGRPARPVTVLREGIGRASRICHGSCDRIAMRGVWQGEEERQVLRGCVLSVQQRAACSSRRPVCPPACACGVVWHVDMPRTTREFWVYRCAASLFGIMRRGDKTLVWRWRCGNETMLRRKVKVAASRQV